MRDAPNFNRFHSYPFDQGRLRFHPIPASSLVNRIRFVRARSPPACSLVVPANRSPPLAKHFECYREARCGSLRPYSGRRVTATMPTKCSHRQQGSHAMPLRSQSHASLNTSISIIPPPRRSASIGSTDAARSPGRERKYGNPLPQADRQRGNFHWHPSVERRIVGNNSPSQSRRKNRPAPPLMNTTMTFSRKTGFRIVHGSPPGLA